ncbi:heparinase II/III family protein [Bacillus sp. 3255]|uniref:heparinase II/III domain-containing protein n=1 Tax=Bacillus sp. 3255 TaxID=2817904 RepID=UPI00286378B2|nr:heparinase II/III family protein [Bacillus sp. 3255]MDR6882418.1 hypothetical protein [Bacillus sp. 3255]
MNDIQLKRLKRNVSSLEFSHVIQDILTEAERMMNISYSIGATERGDWGHYYYCSHDASRLSMSWEKPKNHLCPLCGTEWEGEPYDSAWVSLAHSAIANGMKSLVLASLIKQEITYSQHAKSIFIAYATHYKGYQIHGSIPYNGPGKLFAQTLDESHWILDLCMAYLMISDQWSKKEKEIIKFGLFEPCARFLIDHREQQIHNHAVLINSAIASLGFLLDDKSIISAGLYGEYGLIDQIERGILTDGFWYEGAFQYHFYTLHPIIQYCMIVEGSSWDLRYNPKIKSMFDFPLDYILPDGFFASLNDASSKAGLHSYAHFYEVALDWYNDIRYLELLELAYGISNLPDHDSRQITTIPRNSIFALLYGEPLEDMRISKFPGYERVLINCMSSHSSSNESGLTKLINRRQWHLTIKHSLFGGEHDHLDRLGLSFGCGRLPLFIDPGTTAYAVPAHYAWFKHTYSHNTICVNGKDQPPADAKLITMCKESWGAWTESAVDWCHDEYYLKNKIILPAEMCSWDNEAYDGVGLRRINVLTDRFLLDIVKVTVPVEKEIDLLFHMNGQLVDESVWSKTDDTLSELSQEMFKNKRKKPFQATERFIWHMGEAFVEHIAFCSKQSTLYTACTLDNPPNQVRQTLIERANIENEVMFINAFSYDHVIGSSPMALEVTKQGETSYDLKLTVDGSDYLILFNWEMVKVELKAFL